MKLLGEDPYLSRLKLLAPGWDGVEPGQEKHLAEYNDGFMMDMRSFLKGDEDQLNRLVYHIRHNPGQVGVVNYMANTNGFTLMDMVSYDTKHNEANGEENRDGTDYNQSWNCGVEGPSRKKRIMQMRRKQIRNALLMLFLSQGTPLLMMGDEFGRTKKGNNNSYCQDNDISWLNWGLLNSNSSLHEFVKHVIQFRKEHSAVSYTHLHLSKTIDGEKILDDISFILGREDKVALVGPNERAKTVLFKILSGEMEPDEGSYKWGLTTSQAYFPKDNSAEFDNDDTIVEWLTQYSPEKDVTYVRGFLGRMLFAGEDGVKKVKVLSGGEKVRCMLSKMMISGANVLMLDEPTDHLDMESIDALNRGMIKFPGVMIFSSRDHQIVQTTANRIMEIINGKLVDKITTYDEYLESDEMARKRFTFTLTESEEADD